jgi:tRNA(Ile2) C34 agmatinyltransferase TiaS
MPTPAAPGTNQFRCDSCGRRFNTQEEIARHQVDCKGAEQSGAVPPRKHVEPEDEEITKARH